MSPPSSQPTAPIRVLIVDDSAFMRRALSTILERTPDLIVVGIARNGAEALERLDELAPDVVTLDITMPVMDGLTALARIMARRPTPCVVVSSLTQAGAAATVEAYALGAVACVGKPSGTVSLDIETQAAEIVAAVRAAAGARVRHAPIVRRPASRRIRPAPPRAGAGIAPPQPAAVPEAIVAIGVSTGGPQTLLEILPALPATLPAAVLIVQHMPPRFTASLAERLDAACALPVREARQNEGLQPGAVYVAPGGTHLTVARSILGRGAVAQLGDHPAGLPFCPSVDVLFHSLVQTFPAITVGVLLTGMGDDGADGMVRLREAGAVTLAESEASAIVFGMPREAIARGGASRVVPASGMAGAIRQAVDTIVRRGAASQAATAVPTARDALPR